MSRSSSFPFPSRLSHAICGAVAVLTLSAAAAPVWATGAGEKAAPAGQAPHAITVQPGQSLNDIAAAVTQSRDPTVLANAGRALFDANQQAFMKRDPSRLRLGATLTVPPLDASGAAIVHGASASAAGSAAHAATSAPAVSGTHVAPASHAASPAPAVSGSQVAPAPHAASPAPAVSGAHAAPAAHAASPALGVSGAQVAPATHAAPSAAGASGVQAAPAAHPGPATDAGITAKAAPSTPVGVSAAQAVPAEGGGSGPHVWSGAIQSAPVAGSDAGVPSAPAGVPAPVTHASPAPAAAAPQPRPSSLQQLLALKNRVLMELQKHGIGKAPAAGPGGGGRSQADAPAPRPGAAVTAAASAASGVPASGGATGTARAAKPAARPAASAAAPSLAAIASQIDWRAVGGAGGVLAALLAGWAWRRRRQARRADQVEGQEAEAAAPSSAGGAEPLLTVAPEMSSQPEASGAQDASIARAPVTAGKRAAAGVAADAFAAQSAADPLPVPAREVAFVSVQQRPTQPEVEQSKAEQSKIEQPRAERLEMEQPRIEQPRVEQPKPEQPKPEQQQDKQQQDEQQVMEIHNEPLVQGAIDDVPAGQSSAPSAADAQQAFPHDAIEALDSLDMPLPPRTASEPSALESDASISGGLSIDEKNATNGLASSHPPVADHASASLHDAEQEGGPLDDDGIRPFTGNGDGAANRPSVLPPLGGAQFGVLKLDFDLDLPSVPGAVLPAFTPAELAKIARNKLDLASEYVELGDLSGARTLLQEVLDASDAGTRDDARALMTKLADAS
ncbi:Motility protein FimV [Burkholderia sp. lig30]|nr:Motility protein FimV [Burkholderia sp. lig30]